MTTRALGRIGGPEVVEAMLARLDDETAVQVLGECGELLPGAAPAG